jgi:hypothetical protein
MKTLHIAPGDSAGGSLMNALRDAGRDEEVLRWLDDLSCGPINPPDSSIRARWWASLHEHRDVESGLDAFWTHAENTADRRVVWFGRHSALELSFFLYWAHRLGDQPYDIMDVTRLKLPYIKKDGSEALTSPAASVATIPTNALGTLLNDAKPITLNLRDEAKAQWTKLKDENALLRIVTADGLASAPIDYFDQILMENVTSEPSSLLRIIAKTTLGVSDTYYQVRERFLQSRLGTLIDNGTLMGEGDPADLLGCRIWRPR